MRLTRHSLSVDEKPGKWSPVLIKEMLVEFSRVTPNAILGQQDGQEERFVEGDLFGSTKVKRGTTSRRVMNRDCICIRALRVFDVPKFKQVDFLIQMTLTLRSPLYPQSMLH